MRKLFPLFCFLASALAASAQVLTDKTGVMVQPTSYFQGSCSSGRIGRSSDTGQAYRCAGGTWKSVDLPECAVSPPSGACTGSATCLATISSAPYLYTCNAGTWALISGAGGSGSAPGGSSGQAQFNSNPTTLGGSSALTFDTSSGAMTRLVVPTSPWALPSDGGFYCDPNTECAYASGGTFYPLMGKWEYDANNDGTVDYATNVLNVPPFAQYQDFDTDHDGTIDLRIVGDYNGDRSLTFSDIQSAACTLQGLSISSGGLTPQNTICSGTPRTTPATLVILPGVYHGTYRQSVTIKANGFRIIGSGRDTTKITMDGATGFCTSTDAVGGLDNNNSTRDFLSIFNVQADDVEIRGLTLDGNNPQIYQRGQNYGCNRYDFNCDGVVDDPTPTNRDCTSGAVTDRHVGIAFGDNQNLSILDSRFLNFNRGAVVADALVSYTKAKNLTIKNNLFDGGGEHTIQTLWTGTRIEGNLLRNCGSSSCILFLATNEIVISGNTFQDWTQSAIYREINGSSFSNAQAKNVITNNTFTDSVSGVATWFVPGQGAIVLNAQNSSLVEINYDTIISNNQIEMLGSGGSTGVQHTDAIQFGGDSDSASSKNNRLVINGNVIKMKTKVNYNQQVGVIYLRGLRDAVVSNNMIDFSTDDTVQDRSALLTVGCANCTITANTFNLTGSNTHGILGYALNDSQITGNTFTDAANGGTGKTMGDVYLATGANAIVSDTIITGTIGNVRKYGIIVGSAYGMVTVANTVCRETRQCITTNQNTANAYTIVRGVHNYATANTIALDDGSSSGHLIVEGASCFGVGCNFTNPNGLTTQAISEYGWDHLIDTNADGTLDTTSVLRIRPKTRLIPSKGAAVAMSSGTKTLDDGEQFALTSGSTRLDTINTCDADRYGREITLYCEGATGLVCDGCGNVDLKGSSYNFDCSKGDGYNWLKLACGRAGQWYEISRGYNTVYDHLGSWSGTLFNGAISNTTTYYIPANGWTGTLITTEAQASTAGPATAVTGRGLACVVSGNITVGTWAFTLRSSSSSTSLTCSITGSVNHCEDTTHTAAISAGGVYDIMMVPTSTPTTPTWAACTVTFTSP